MERGETEPASLSEGAGLGRKQDHSITPNIVHTPASARTACRAHSGFSSRIGSQGGTHGNESVKDTCLPSFSSAFVLMSKRQRMERVCWDVLLLHVCL